MALICIVEDYFPLKLLYTEELRVRGYEVVSAGSEKELFGIMKNSRIPDLFVLDVSMLGMGGVGIMRKIRESYPKAKIILNTAHKKEEIIGADEANAFVDKNGNLEDLIGAVKTLVK